MSPEQVGALLCPIEMLFISGLRIQEGKGMSKQARVLDEGEGVSRSPPPEVVRVAVVYPRFRVMDLVLEDRLDFVRRLLRILLPGHVVDRCPPFQFVLEREVAIAANDKGSTDHVVE